MKQIVSEFLRDVTAAKKAVKESKQIDEIREQFNDFLAKAVPIINFELDEKHSFPASTLELLQKGLEENCDCGEACELGVDDRVVIMCVACGKYFHEQCSEEDDPVDACPDCGKKVLLHVNAMTVIAEDDIKVRAPFKNKYGA